MTLTQMPTREDLIGRKVTMMHGDTVGLMNADGHEISVPNGTLRELQLDFDDHMFVTMKAPSTPAAAAAT